MIRNIIRNWEPNAVNLIIILTLLQVLVTLLTNGFTLSFDEAIWHYIGRNWFRHGLDPYTGGVDNKSPLIFAIFGLSDTLFGLNYWFPRLLGTICQSIGIYYIYKIAKHTAGEQAGVLAISFYGLSELWHVMGGRYVAFTQTFEIMFIIIAFFLFLTAQNKKDFFTSGLMAGIAFGFRLSAIWGILTIFIISLRKSRIETLMFCGGVITSLFLLGFIGFVVGVDIPGFLTYGLTDNFGAGSTTDHSLLWKLEGFSERFFYSELILFYPFVLGWVFIKGKIDVFTLWLIFEFIGINIVGIYGTVHLKDLLPALSLMSAFTITYLVNVHKVPLKPVLLIIWITFFPKLLEPLTNLKRLLLNGNDIKEVYGQQPYIKPYEGSLKRLGKWIRANTTDKEMVFVAGNSAIIQAYSERISPTIHFNVTQTQMAKERFFRDMQINKPAMVLIPMFSEYEVLVGQDLRQFVDKLVTKDYYLDRSIYNYKIYRLKNKVI